MHFLLKMAKLKTLPFCQKKKRKKQEKFSASNLYMHSFNLSVCVEVLQPSQLNGVMSSLVSLPNHTFTGQA